MQAEDDRMMTDDGVQTQQQTQATQQASQHDVVLDTHLWGYLIPCSANLRRIDFQKFKPTYRIGRNREEHKNDIILPGMKISNFHCIIEWDKDETTKSAIKVTDLSSNGTFINNEKIGKGKVMILRDGNELAFGSHNPQPANHGVEDYRFIYRHIASGPPNRGFHKYYDLQHELGKGSFATVMKALHKEEDKWYAVKMIQASQLRRNLTNTSGEAAAAEEAKATHNFAREISILERLQHPNICQLKEVFFEPYSINLVLEWVPGGDLLEYILKRGPIEPDAQALTRQICDALAYVHGLGIAHRDLKPENVLLSADDPPVVKVADFGLAKVVDSMTMLRTMCGTPAYLAPEVVNQVPGNEGYDRLVDSWSVGVIVFSMLTMSTPFGDDDPTKDVKTRVRTRQVDWQYFRECVASPEEQSPAEEFIRRLLEYEPRQRMSLTEARDHAWLTGPHPANDATPPPPPPAAGPSTPNKASALADASMRSVVSNDMAVDEDEPMDSGRMTPPYVPSPDDDDDDDDDAAAVGPSSARTNGNGAVMRQPSKLVRRSDVIRRARDRGEELPSPSQEMRLRAAAEEEAEDQYLRAVHSNSNGRANKRKQAARDFERSLSPMSEEDENVNVNVNGDADADADADEVEIGDSGPARAGRSIPSKRGRAGGAKKAVVAAAPPAARRGRGRAVSAGEESEGGGRRRSSRLNQSSPAKATKVARRA